MMKPTENSTRIVITGLGVISPLGLGVVPFWDNLCSGKTCEHPTKAFDTTALPSHVAVELTDFNAEDFLDKKGLRVLDRATRMALSAAALALSDGALVVTSQNQERIGVCLGAALGSINSRYKFVSDLVHLGPKSFNPALFPNTTGNLFSSNIAIRNGLKGLNTTISSGFNSSLDAIEFSAMQIAQGRADIMISGGIEELSQLTYAGLAAWGFTARAQHNNPERSLPFDRSRSGAVLGEGAVVLILESLASALGRGAKIYAEYLGQGSVPDPNAYGRYNLRGTGTAQAIKKVLGQTGINAAQIDCLVSSANSTHDGDLAESNGIRRAFRKNSVEVTAIKSLLGETLSASAAFQVAVAGLALQKGIIPGTRINEQDSACKLNLVRTTKVKKIRYAMVSSTTPLSSCSAALLAGYEENILEEDR